MADPVPDFNPGRRAWVLAMVILVADQVTKYLVRAHFDLHSIYPVIDGFFNLTHVQNKGAAWGMLHGRTTILSIVSIVMMIGLYLGRKHIFYEHPLQRTAFGLLAGGIVGNLIDRIWFQQVTDFLQVFIGSYEWPSFNIADSAICVGVVLYILSTYRRPNEDAGPAHSYLES